MKLFLRDRRKEKKKGEGDIEEEEHRATIRRPKSEGKREGRKRKKVRAEENLCRRREGRAKDKEEWKGSRKKERVTRWGRGEEEEGK